MTQTVYLVSGASRGVGFALIEELSSRPNTIVYAGVRSYPPPADSDLAKLAERLPEVVLPIKLTSGDQEDNKAAAELIARKVGKVDVIIANAGVSSGITDLKTVTTAQLHSDFNVNILGPIVLYQNFVGLLAKSDTSAKFVVISSEIAQITNMPPYPMASYGISKAGVNFVAKKINEDNKELISFPMHPGFVRTDMGRAGAADFGMKIEDMDSISPIESAVGVLAVIDQATKETHGGKFWTYAGEQMQY